MRIIKLEKRVGDFYLKIDNLEIEKERVHGFIGGNGSGKTTLAKLIMGILEPDGGEIDFEGVKQSEVIMTSQRPYLLHRSVYENVIYPLKIRGVTPSEGEVDQWLQRYGLLEKKGQQARSLSSGERQKLSFIRGAIIRPQIFIIDETFSNLDPDTIHLMSQEILKGQQEGPRTYLIISHQLSQLHKLCDQLHVLDKGQVVESGPCKEVLFHSKRPETKRYLASYVLEREN